MKKNEKHYTHPFLQPPIPHHQRKNSLGKKKPPNLPTLKNNETYVSHATQETTLKNSPHPPQKNSPFPIHPKNLLWKGMELPHLLFTQWNPFENKNKS